MLNYQRVPPATWDSPAELVRSSALERAVRSASRPGPRCDPSMRKPPAGRTNLSRAQTMTPFGWFGMGLGRVGLPQKHWEWKHAERRWDLKDLFFKVKVWMVKWFSKWFQVIRLNHGGLVALSSHTPAETWLLVPAMRLLPLCICPTDCFSWQECFYWLANVKIPIFIRAIIPTPTKWQ